VTVRQSEFRTRKLEINFCVEAIPKLEQPQCIPAPRVHRRFFAGFPRIKKSRRNPGFFALLGTVLRKQLKQNAVHSIYEQFYSVSVAQPIGYKKIPVFRGKHISYGNIVLVVYRQNADFRA
jgi:hypothetical protein